MSSTSELSEFAARLRESIRTSEWGAGTSLGSDSRVCEADFGKLALPLFALQFGCNAPYRRLCEARGARPDTVKRWADIPAAPTSAFKEFNLSCLPPAERTTVFHSSGTTRQVPHSSLAHMFETIRREFGEGGSAFVGQVAKDGAWALDAAAVRERLRATSASGQPLLAFGTAFSYVHLLDYLAEHDLRFALPPGSCALETGGYKGRSRSLPKAVLHALITERLGIASDRIVCEYGMSELSSQAYDRTIAPFPVPHHASRITHHISRLF